MSHFVYRVATMHRTPLHLSVRETDESCRLSGLFICSWAKLSVCETSHVVCQVYSSVRERTYLFVRWVTSSVRSTYLYAWWVSHVVCRVYAYVCTDCGSQELWEQCILRISHESRLLNEWVMSSTMSRRTCAQAVDSGSCASWDHTRNDSFIRKTWLIHWQDIPTLINKEGVSSQWMSHVVPMNESCRVLYLCVHRQ